MSESFTTRAWEAARPLYRAILDHPFNVALAQGRLEPDRFRHYIVQDAHYLVAFARALALVAARAEAAEDMVRFAESARSALVVERALHDDYMRRFGVEAEASRPSPTCQAYGDYLVAAAWGAPVAVAIAALLPCFWVYSEVGLHIAAESGPDNPYQAWIDTYADPTFAAAVAEVRVIADRLAGAETAAGREAMLAAFLRATELEWMFWDAAYRQESWPLSGA